MHKVLQQPPLEWMLPLVLFLTDGLPTSGITSESAIRDLVVTANSSNRWVYTFGVGYDLNASLLESIAYTSKALPVFVLPGQDRTFEYTFGLEGADPKYGFIPRLWASRRIAQLIGQIRQPSSGSSPGTRPSWQGRGTAWVIFGNWSAVPPSNSMAGRAGDRSGSGAVNQSLNMVMQRSQDVLNRDNSYLNSQVECERIVNIQQANDLEFYFKDGRWVDSRLAEIVDQVDPHRVVEYGSDEFFQIAEALACENRQGALAFAQDILILLEGQIVLVDILADLQEEYRPIDPATSTAPPPVRAGR